MPTNADHLRDPTSWIMSAQVHRRAAHVLNDKLQSRFGGEGVMPKPGGGGVIRDPNFLVDLEMFKPIYMLAALSLELIFKAVIVARDPTAIDDNGRADWQRHAGGHDLVALANRTQLAGLDFALLERIEPFVTWKARYPADRETFYEPPVQENFADTMIGDRLEQINKMYRIAYDEIKRVAPQWWEPKG
jgi:hypothetical protein